MFSVCQEIKWAVNGIHLFFCFYIYPESSKFAFLEPAFKKDRAVGRLVSPLIPSGSRCLKFESLRYGANVGYLKVFMDVGHKRVTYVNWQGGQVINNWEKSSLNLPSDDNYQVCKVT